MGAKTWMLVYADEDARQALSTNPELDREATFELATRLFPKDKLEPLEDGDLSYTCPPGNELIVGCFRGVSVVAAKEFGIDYPSRLRNAFIEEGRNGAMILHAMHSVVDWFAFAQWKNGRLIRSLSLSPDSGILEDIGSRLAFEEPYWSGQRPVADEDGENAYPLPFHPLEMAEDALKELFGYQLEGFADESLLEPESVRLARYKRPRSWWKLWR